MLDLSAINFFIVIPAQAGIQKMGKSDFFTKQSILSHFILEYLFKTFTNIFKYFLSFFMILFSLSGCNRSGGSGLDYFFIRWS
jgi:hypothetical protein